MLCLLNGQTSRSSLKLPQLQSKGVRTQNNSFSINLTKSSHVYNCNRDYIQTIECQHEDDQLQVAKLNDWSLNKPIAKKAKTQINAHNLSFIFRSSINKKSKSSILKTYMNIINNNITESAHLSHKFLQIQVYLTKLQYQLKKIQEINYFSIFKNLQYCSGLYQYSYNVIFKTLKKFLDQVRSQISHQQNSIISERQQHIKKIQQIQISQQNQPSQQYKKHVDSVRQRLQEKQNNLKPIKKLLRNLQLGKTRALKHCLSLGYDIREQGLVWILRQLGEIPKIHQFPHYLSEKEVNYIINKFVSSSEITHCSTKMKSHIFGKSVNEAYEFVNRRKRRELSLIKESQQLTNFYKQKIKVYSPDQHHYLFDSTLQIASQIQKSHSKPTRYEIIYKQTGKKLNRFCKQKIHGKPLKQTFHTGSRHPHKHNSTLIIEQFSKMLMLSVNQTRRIQQLESKQSRQMDQILRQLRSQRYKQIKQKQRQQTQHREDVTWRNPVTILGCLVGKKKAEKIIQHKMFRI